MADILRIILQKWLSLWTHVMVFLCHKNPFLKYFLDSIKKYLFIICSALILLNAEMNKTDKRDQAPPCLYSNEEGKREEELFI